MESMFWVVTAIYNLCCDQVEEPHFKVVFLKDAGKDIQINISEEGRQSIFQEFTEGNFDRKNYNT